MLVKISKKFGIYKTMCYICATIHFMTNKTKPIGIRFNEEDLSLALVHSRKKTKQALVDWLIKCYADQFRVVENPFIKKQVVENVVEVKKEEIKSVVNAFVAPKYENKPKMILNRTLDQWLQLKRDCESQEEWNELKQQIENSNLSSRQKQLIYNTQ